MTSKQPFEHYPALASWIERLANTSGLSLGEWMIFVGSLNAAITAAREEARSTPSEREVRLEAALKAVRDWDSLYDSLPISLVVLISAALSSKTEDEG